MLTITTYDWVPKFPRGWVRDLRVRWACEEAGLPYRIDTVPVKDRTPEHLARQPFHQVPMLRDGELSIFESGAIVLHLAEKSEALMPRDPPGRAAVQQWLIAALNSVEPWVLRWVVARMFDKDEAAAARALPLLEQRLGQLEAAMAGRDWIAGERFTAADILMADVLRLVEAQGALSQPALQAYVARATARPAFRKAHAAQLAHFEAADAARAAAE
ncbi:glutathione S-transferase family protein [Paracoccus sp. S-4012]|uniref:glutathione S-transferase family protein n=1 Tax=Paracoccus sp. S-4012 TaxID=2665648 RepID=UPI0012AF7210|nr:glutathione S-transferase family protein [Paracoccus sp. S-4012]MRX49747.1 glutathione S-transferase family protein [Paracoccus sp. S-4012]